MIEEIYYLNEDTDQMVDAEKKNVQGKLSAKTSLEDAYIAQYMKNYVWQIDLQTDLYGTVQFPSLPTNFEMLMSKMDFPEKAQKNPNDALFMNPARIDATIADDLGKQLFNSKSFKNLTGLKSTLSSSSHSREFEALAAVVDTLTLKRIFEDTPDGTGAEIKVQDIKSVNQQMTQMSQDVKNAITTYIRRSIDVIKPLLELTAGGTAVKDVMRILNTANSTGQDNVQQWLESVSKIKKDYTEGLKNYEMSALRNQNSSLKDAFALASCIAVSEVPAGCSKIVYIQHVTDELSKAKNTANLDRVVRKYCKNIKSWRDFTEKVYTQDKPVAIELNKLDFGTNESFVPNAKSKHLNEFDDDSLDMAEETLKKEKVTPINYDKLYTDMVNYLSGEIGNAIGDREHWLCFKSVREDMKKLKDRADAEIKKKIELVCKTGGQKSLIKWPMKAEGLLSMWERYSSELDMRINNRINQLTGLGSVETGSATMLEDFLRSTYPQIVAMLLTYRTLFDQLNVLYKDDFVPQYTLEDVDQIKEECAEEFGTRMKTLLLAFKSRTK